MLSATVEDVVGLNYSGYITNKDFCLLKDTLKSNASLAGVSTYDSVHNVMMKLLVDKYENEVTLTGTTKELLATLYRGAKYFGELFIINEKPEWWGL